MSAVGIDDLAAALAQAQTVLAGVRADQASTSTPCASWAVTELVTHLLTDLDQFVVMAEGRDVDWTATREPVAPDTWAAEFADGSARLLAAWRATGPNLGLGMQVAELAVHTWDLDVATGQGTPLDPGLAEQGLAWMTGMLQDEYRGSEADGKSFGPRVEVADDAGAYERLAAFSGRTP